MRLARLSLRSRLLVAAVMGAAAFLAALTVGFNLILRAELRHDANDLLRQRAAAHLATLTVVDGRLRAAEAPDEASVDSQIWLYAGGRALERPNTGAREQRAADALAAGARGRRFREVSATDTRLYAVPVVRAGRRLGTLVAGTSLAPYERTAHIALLASLVFALLILGLIALAARWAVSKALQPVARMTAEAAAWSEHDLDRRFALGEPRDELTRLAATFDGLLNRLAASLRREQRFSAELSHELRTPLSKLIAESELALRREREPAAYRQALEAIARNASEMSRTLEALLAAARAETAGDRGVSDIDRSARRVAAACADRGIAIEISRAAAPLRAGAEADVVERILAPLLENGCRYARSRVRVGFSRDNGQVRVRIEDDGPGVAPEDRERIFEPGFRDDVADGGHPGAGLGLALARRLARAARGDVTCVSGPEGGVFEVRLPLA